MSSFCAVLYLVNTYIINMLVGHWLIFVSADSLHLYFYPIYNSYPGIMTSILSSLWPTFVGFMTWIKDCYCIYQGRSTSIRIIDNWDTWSFAWFELFVSCNSLSDTTFFKYPHFICKFSCIGDLCFLITDCCGCQRGPQICGPCLPCSAKGSCSYKTAIPA